MVLHVLADVGEVHNRLDAKFLQRSGVANPGQLKKLWSGDRPRGEDNFVGGIYDIEWTYVKSTDEDGRSFYQGNESRARCRGSKLYTAENRAFAMSARLKDLGHLCVDEEVDIGSRCESRLQVGGSCANTRPVRDRKRRPA